MASASLQLEWPCATLLPNEIEVEVTGRLLRKPLAHIWLLLFFLWASLVARRVRICLQCGRPGFDLWVEKIPWRRKWQPTPVFLPTEFHGQRILAGYSPWGCKESDTTEQLSCFLLCPLPFLLPEIQMRGPMWGHYLGDQKEWKMEWAWSLGADYLLPVSLVLRKANPGWVKVLQWRCIQLYGNRNSSHTCRQHYYTLLFSYFVCIFWGKLQILAQTLTSKSKLWIPHFYQNMKWRLSWYF